jgi:transcriptional regulator
MYQPRQFRVDDPARLHRLIREHALGVLVVALDGTLEASHVPVLLDAHIAPHGALRFHLARANPLAGALDGTREALFVFQAQQAYISPDWYASEHMVPTWNYAAVHACGRPAPMDDDALQVLLDDLSAAQESRLDKRAWTTDKMPGELYARMRRAIAGFHMPIARIDGKWKMGQNRSEADRRGVIAALAALDAPGAKATAEVMRSVLDDGPADRGA